MAKISSYEGPKVETAVIKGPQAQPVTPGAFGVGQLAKGVADLAKGFAGMSERIAVTEAEEAVIKFERAKNNLFFNPDTGYFNTQGKTAYDTAKDAEDSLIKLSKTYADSVSSPRARELFMKVADRHISSGQNDIMRHSSKGLQSWEISTIKAQVENSIENAALLRNDEKKLSVQRKLGLQAIRDAAELEGITGVALNERLQTYKSTFASATIDAAITDGSVTGKEALDKYGDRLEGNLRQQYEQKLLKKQELEKTQSDSQAAVMMANRIVSDYEGDRTKILDAISKIEDPELQSKARKEAMYQVNQIETARTEERKKAYDAAEKFVAGNGSIESFKAAFPDQWDKLSLKQQKALEKGEPPINDWNTWHNIMSLSDNEIRNMRPDDIEKYVMNLDTSHRDKFYTMWKNLRDSKEATPGSQVGRTRAAQTKSAVEQLMGKKSSKWSPNDLSRADTFYALIDSEARAREQVTGKDLTPEEFTNMINNMTRKITIERDFWFDTEKGIGDIPEEDLGVLTEALRNRGIPITSANIIRAYEQANR